MATARRALTITTIVPTFNRREQLVRCLAALDAQTLPRDRYDVIVIDDGSTDGTGDTVAGLASPQRLAYLSQPNRGPAAARNLGISTARGDLVLFIGDDVIAGRRLLEEHVAAHQRHSDRTAAVLGRLDWPDARPRTPLMDYVCGKGHLQFAYDDIRRMPRLDYRFFYTSNVSVKRAFLDATQERFDTSFRYAAFEDTDLAYRLQRRGLTLHYADGARAVHDHTIDVEGFVSREERAGEMAVHLYRKHPELDHLVQVAFLTRPLQAVDRLMDSAVVERLVDTAAQADGLLRRTAASIDSDARAKRRPAAALRQDMWFVVFSAARLRGKVRALVGAADGARLAAAEALVAGLRELEFMDRAGTQIAGIAPPEVAPLLHQIAGQAAWVRREVEALGGVPVPRTTGVNRGLRRLATHRYASGALRSLDVLIELRLQRSNLARTLARYRALRGALKRRLS